MKNVPACKFSYDNSRILFRMIVTGIVLIKGTYKLTATELSTTLLVSPDGVSATGTYLATVQAGYPVKIRKASSRPPMFLKHYLRKESKRTVPGRGAET
jgi:hypothetical protein